MEESRCRQNWVGGWGNEKIRWLYRARGVGCSPWSGSRDVPPSPLGGGEGLVMKSRLLLCFFFGVGLFVASAAPTRSAPRSLSLPAAENSEQSGTSPHPENSVIIPGPLRSFLRMAGLRQKV